jgi:hypothetical protein
MNRILELRESSAHAGNAASRWRIGFIALVLALAIGSAGQTPLAQAAAAGNFVEFELSVYPKKPPRICVNEKLTLYVGVSKTIFRVINEKEFEIPGRAPDPVATGIKVSGVGTLEKLGGGDLMSLSGENTFIFKSDKPGRATLRFSVPIEESWVGAKEVVIGPAVTLVKEITVKVGCKVKVKTVIHFPVAIYDITVISDDAVMTADEAGTFTGSTSMYWAYSNFNLAPCTIEIGATDSQVDMTGQLDEDGGQFTATQTFQPQTDAGIVSCPGGIGGGEGAFTVSPLTFSVASSGGLSIQTATAEGVSGLAHIVVTPEDEGAAFIPGDHQVSWDDFSSLFSTLLALQ